MTGARGQKRGRKGTRASEGKDVAKAARPKRQKSEAVDPSSWRESLESFSPDVVGANYQLIEEKAQELEIQQYLEKYLYPNLDTDATAAHYLSIAAITVEKYTQGVEPFAYVGEDASRFQDLVLLLANASGLSTPEKRIRVSFFNIAFNSLEVPVVRKVCLPYVHVQLWLSLSPERLAEELDKAPPKARKQLAKARDRKKDDIETSRVVLIPGILEDFVRSVEEEAKQMSEEKSKESSERTLYLDRTADFFIDLLSQLPTRRFFRPLLDDLQVVVKCRRAIRGSVGGEKFSVLSRLLDLTDFYLEFEIDDHTGEPLSREMVVKRHCDKLRFLQLTAFKLYREKLEDMALSNIASIESRATLSSHLKVLCDEELLNFAAALRCVPKGGDFDRAFAEETILHKYCARRSQADSFKREPLYPTEDLIWNNSVVPPSDFSYAKRSLSLPKLNLQFLTMYDYLLRNYTLYRLESTSEVRDDLEAVIKRMRPRVADRGQTYFDGWARMASTVRNFKIIETKPPRLDSPAPKSVLCEVEYDLRRLPFDARREWDEAKEHDVMFLVCIDKPEVAFADSNDEELTFRQAFGVQFIRGITVSAMLDADGKEVREWEAANAIYAHGDSPVRRFRAYLDPVQYFLDGENDVADRLYSKPGAFNLLVRRKAKENNFKAVLETIRNLIVANESDAVVPDWLHDVFLGYGQPGAAAFYNLPPPVGADQEANVLDFYDTFVSPEHLRASFPAVDVVLPKEIQKAQEDANYRVRFVSQRHVKVEAYDSTPIYCVGAKPKRNPVPFTPSQIAAIRSGMEEGLSLIVGPPGTGKTDVAVQIVANLYRSFPEQRILIVTHSNHALNDIFEKIAQRDVDERHLLRLGQGEKALATEKSYSKIGRVNFMLQKRMDRLQEVSKLAASINVPGDHGYTCETAALFFAHTVRRKWEQFQDEYQRNGSSVVKDIFPFSEFFPDAPFSSDDRAKNYEVAKSCYAYLVEVFTELEECRSLELLRNNRDRGDYLLCKQARIIAMTCTHAAIRRDEFIRLGLKYDSLVMEEAGQVLEIETLIPMLLQKLGNSSASKQRLKSPLKRVVLVGDHHQLPPVVKNPALQKYARMSQSLFARFIRLGNPAITLDMQGRARSSIADLYRWRYDKLHDLPLLADGSHKEYALANPGFVNEFQIIDVGEADTESQPVPFFYQNIVEAEYIAALYQYMRLLGYPADRIAVLTTYNGQKHLLRDVIEARIRWNPSIGMPEKITTVDKFQGRQNDYVLLSLVRTRNVGHLRDVRRLVVAMSRARLGLYVFCRKDLFTSCMELTPTFDQLLKKPTTLELRSDERYDTQLTRKASDRGNSKGIVEVSSVEQMAQIVSSYAGQLDEFFRAQSDPQPVEKAAVVDETETVIVEN